MLVGAPMFGEEAYERELHALVASSGWTGASSSAASARTCGASSPRSTCSCTPRSIPEPFGQVVIEGMAAGLAVIASDEGGPAEVIDDGRTGRLFKSRDAGSLAAAMRELCANPAERRRLGEAAAACG